MGGKFRAEGETVAVLNHPNIVPVFDMGETEEFLFIVMQLIAGDSDHNPATASPSGPFAANYAKGCYRDTIAVLDALGYAHNQQVIPRMSMANII